MESWHNYVKTKGALDLVAAPDSLRSISISQREISDVGYIGSYVITVLTLLSTRSQPIGWVLQNAVPLTFDSKPDRK